MRVTSVVFCVSAVIAGYPIAAQAQSASTVIERHISAIGGKKAVEQIVSTDVSGRVSSADGRSGVFTQRTRRPQLFSLSLSWGDSRWRTGFNGRAAWQDDSLDGWRTLYGPAASRVRAEANYANTRLVMPEKLNRVFVKGRDQVRGRPVIVAIAITPDGATRTLFFDATSYLLVKDEQQTDTGVEERFLDDYRRVDQVMEPHLIEWHRNGETFRIAVERITHNAPPDEHAFDAPAAPAEPPLDLDALLSATERNERRAENLRTSYAYTQAMTVRIVDGQGRVTPREGLAFDVFHLGGQPVGRLIRKFGGQTLSEGERRREDERVNRIVREYERQRASGRAGHLTPQALGASSFALRSLWGSLVLQVPVMTTGWFPSYRRIADFTHIRREGVHGRAAVVMEFQPKSGVAAIGDVERQVAKLAGTVWIDEASQQVIRIESYFFDDYDSVVQGSSVWMEQTLVNDEVWLPSRIETNLRRSVNFGALLQALTAVQFTGHKKFTVETDTSVTLPGAGR
jgi:hypothetical protein